MAATRPPKDDDEGSKYFVDGLYTGYFMSTDENDCDTNPDTCTGHFAEYPCGWARYVRRTFVQYYAHWQ